MIKQDFHYLPIAQSMTFNELVNWQIDRNTGISHDYTNHIFINRIFTYELLINGSVKNGDLLSAFTDANNAIDAINEVKTYSEFIDLKLKEDTERVGISSDRFNVADFINSNTRETVQRLDHLAILIRLTAQKLPKPSIDFDNLFKYLSEVCILIKGNESSDSHTSLFSPGTLSEVKQAFRQAGVDIL